MDEIERLKNEKRRELQKYLEPIFHEDGNMMLEILIGALSREFGDSVEEDDRPRFLTALARLPRGSKAKPRPLLDQDRDAGLPFGLIFIEGGIQYKSLKRFDTKDAADVYSRDFLVRFYGEADRAD